MSFNMADIYLFTHSQMNSCTPPTWMCFSWIYIFVIHCFVLHFEPIIYSNHEMIGVKCCWTTCLHAVFWLSFVEWGCLAAAVKIFDVLIKGFGKLVVVTIVQMIQAQCILKRSTIVEIITWSSNCLKKSVIPKRNWIMITDGSFTNTCVGT